MQFHPLTKKSWKLGGTVGDSAGLCATIVSMVQLLLQEKSRKDAKVGEDYTLQVDHKMTIIFIH